ncbi:hypothetical protein AYI68_g3817 [Smittium mucronatum]|uniref:Uncharacterized protein n=1 Tax=Smittium mucronatum TaxID=133383 RepID=A0A1R0GYS9_9FUNG|nr:hypothetical protein AYI68_g3817 [Smittium mucronatum]
MDSNDEELKAQSRVSTPDENLKKLKESIVNTSRLISIFSENEKELKNTKQILKAREDEISKLKSVTSSQQRDIESKIRSLGLKKIELERASRDLAKFNSETSSLKSENSLLMNEINSFKKIDLSILNSKLVADNKKLQSDSNNLKESLEDKFKIIENLNIIIKKRDENLKSEKLRFENEIIRIKDLHKSAISKKDSRIKSITEELEAERDKSFDMELQIEMKQQQIDELENSHKISLDKLSSLSHNHPPSPQEIDVSNEISVSQKIDDIPSFQTQPSSILSTDIDFEANDLSIISSQNPSNPLLTEMNTQEDPSFSSPNDHLEQTPLDFYEKPKMVDSSIQCCQFPPSKIMVSVASQSDEYHTFITSISAETQTPGPFLNTRLIPIFSQPENKMPLSRSVSVGTQSEPPSPPKELISIGIQVETISPPKRLISIGVQSMPKSPLKKSFSIGVQSMPKSPLKKSFSIGVQSCPLSPPKRLFSVGTQSESQFSPKKSFSVGIQCNSYPENPVSKIVPDSSNSDECPPKLQLKNFNLESLQKNIENSALQPSSIQILSENNTSDIFPSHGDNTPRSIELHTEKSEPNITSSLNNIYFDNKFTGLNSIISNQSSNIVTLTSKIDKLLDLFDSNLSSKGDLLPVNSFDSNSPSSFSTHHITSSNHIAIETPELLNSTKDSPKNQEGFVSPKNQTDDHIEDFNIDNFESNNYPIIEENKNKHKESQDAENGIQPTKNSDIGKYNTIIEYTETILTSGVKRLHENPPSNDNVSPLKRSKNTPKTPQLPKSRETTRDISISPNSDLVQNLLIFSPSEQFKTNIPKLKNSRLKSSVRCEIIFDCLKSDPDLFLKMAWEKNNQDINIIFLNEKDLLESILNTLKNESQHPSDTTFFKNIIYTDEGNDHDDVPIYLTSAQLNRVPKGLPKLELHISYLLWTLSKRHKMSKVIESTMSLISNHINKPNLSIYQTSETSTENFIRVLCHRKQFLPSEGFQLRCAILAFRNHIPIAYPRQLHCGFPGRFCVFTDQT